MLIEFECRKNFVDLNLNSTKNYLDPQHWPSYAEKTVDEASKLFMFYYYRKESVYLLQKFFVSSGSVTINDDSSVQILAEEAHKVEDLDISAARYRYCNTRIYIYKHKRGSILLPVIFYLFLASFLACYYDSICKISPVVHKKVKHHMTVLERQRKLSTGTGNNFLILPYSGTGT
jgi:hypothetical protein